MFSLLFWLVDQALLIAFNLPFQLLGLSAIGEVVWLRVSLWGTFLGMSTMLLYALCSNQEELAELKSRVKEARREMREYDGTDFGEMQDRMKRAFSLSLRQLKLMAIPTLIAGTPVLIALVCMEGAYTHRLPDTGEEVEVTVDTVEGASPDAVRWQPDSNVLETSGATTTLAWPNRGDGVHLEVVDSERALLELPVFQPARRLERFHWTHWFFADPAYLPPDSPVRAVTFELPRREVLGFGPDWMRGWHLLFLTVLSIVAGGLKVGLGID